MRIKKLESQHPHLQLSQAAEQIAGQFRKYMVIRSVASILTGFVTFLFALLVGLELALAWGVITFVLCMLSLLIPIPYARILLAGVVAIAGMMACKMMHK